jgi:hypothetical protein
MLISLSATMFNNHVTPRFERIISPEQAKAISDSLSAISNLLPDQQRAVRTVMAEAYNYQNIFLTAMTGVGLITACFLWERKPRTAE